MFGYTFPNVIEYINRMNSIILEKNAILFSILVHFTFLNSIAINLRFFTFRFFSTALQIEGSGWKQSLV